MVKGNHRQFMTKHHNKTIMFASKLWNRFHKGSSRENLLDYKKEKNIWYLKKNH